MILRISLLHVDQFAGCRIIRRSNHPDWKQNSDIITDLCITILLLYHCRMLEKLDIIGLLELDYVLKLVRVEDRNLLLLV